MVWILSGRLQNPTVILSQFHHPPDTLEKRENDVQASQKAPQMTLKWSPKSSQGSNGRPSRNMHRHGRIACPPPLEELHFRSFFKDPTNITNKYLETRQFEQSASKLPQKGVSFRDKNIPQRTFWGPWALLGSKWVPGQPKLPK